MIELGPDRIRILEDGRTTGHRLAIGETTLAPHSVGPPQHRHFQHDESFYVVSGHGPVHCRAERLRRTPRTLVLVPPGAAHTFANPGDEPLVMLNTFTPDRYVQFVPGYAISPTRTPIEPTTRTRSIIAPALDSFR